MINIGPGAGGGRKRRGKKSILPNIFDDDCRLIDNIFMNDPLHPSISGLFLNDISDHLPIFSLILYNNSTSDKDKYVFFREKNAHNLSAFKDELYR